MVWIITFNRKFKFQRDKFLLQLAQRKVQKGKLLCTVLKERETNLLEHYLHFLHAIYNMEPSAFRDFAFFKHSFQCKNRLLKRISCWLIVIQESEIFTSAICDPPFFSVHEPFQRPAPLCTTLSIHLC